MLGQQAPKDDFRRNFDTKEISREVSKNIFQSSNPRPHLATDEVWRLAQVMGTMTRDNCRAQVKTSYKERSRSGESEAEPAATQISKKFGRSLPIFAKNTKFFPKIFIIFTHFSNERNLSIAKGRSPIRARVRTQAGEIKTSESRHASIR